MEGVAGVFFAGVFFAGVFFAAAFFAATGALSLGGETKCITDAPSSRVSAFVSMLGAVSAFLASFLILGDVIAAGALGIASFYVQNLASWSLQYKKRRRLERGLTEL